MSKINLIKAVEAENMDAVKARFDSLMEEKKTESIRKNIGIVSSSLLISEEDTEPVIDQEKLNESFKSRYNTEFKPVTIMEKLQRVSQKNVPGVVILENKDVVKVLPEHANAILGLYSKLDERNRKHLVMNISENKEGYNTTVAWIDESK